MKKDIHILIGGKMEPFDKEDTKFQLRIRDLIDIPEEILKQDIVIFHCPYDLKFLDRLNKPSILYNHLGGRQNTFMFDTILREGTSDRYKKIILRKDHDWVLKKHNELFKKADVILSNSNFIRSMTLKYIGVDSFVCYPPVDIKKFKLPKNIPIRNYFLSVQRYHWQKRIDIQIEAFRGIKENLILIYNSKNGIPYELKRMTEDMNNIQILERVNDKELLKLYQNAKATIQTGYLEDFGLIPVESMACGTPNIVVDEAGFKETVNRTELGIRIKEPYVQNLRKAILNIKEYNSKILKKEAEKYSMERFKKEMKQYIKLAVERHDKKNQF